MNEGLPSPRYRALDQVRRAPEEAASPLPALGPSAPAAAAPAAAARPGARSGGGSRPDPYLLVAVPLILWALLVTLRHTWTGDFQLHLATVDALAGHLWVPKDPLVGAATGSPYYSPYTVLLGAIKAATGASAQTVLECAGIADLALLLLALRRFCRHLGGSAVAVAALLFTLVLWGLHPVAWSGFLGLYSLSWGMSYPSVLATALMLVVWDAFLRHRADPGAWRPLAEVVVLGAMVVLIHPFTAVNTVLGLAAFALADIRALLRGRPLRLAIGAAVAAVVVIAWPWSDLTTLFGSAGAFDPVHKVLVTGVIGDWGLQDYGLALVALPALVTAGRRPLGRELQVLFLLSVTAVAFGAATGRYGLARTFPVVMLSLHLSLATYLGNRWTGRVRLRAVYAAVTLVVCGIGLYGEAGGLIRAYWGEVSTRTVTAWRTGPVSVREDGLFAGLHPGDVVVADDPVLARTANAHGLRTVAPAWPYPFVDEAVRRHDTERFFAAGTSPVERLAVADRYRVACVFVRHHTAVLGPGAVPGFRVDAVSAHGDVTRLCRRPAPA